MQYRTFRYTPIDAPYTWQYVDAGGILRNFINYDTLVYASGGAVASFAIDNDYMVANNTTVSIIKETKAQAGQPIVLIDDYGAYDTGIVTSVDNKKLQILYKSTLDIFNDEILNPMRSAFTKDEEIGEGETPKKVTYLYDAVEDTALVLASHYATAGRDKYLRLPLIVRTSGVGTDAVWEYTSNTINLRQWLVDLFNKYNVIVQCKLVFEVDRAYIDVYIAHKNTSGRLIKNNVHGMELTHAVGSSAKATVCTVISKDTKQPIATYYLLANNTVTTVSTAENRVQPYKFICAELDTENEDGATPQSVAENNLLYGEFNHYISVAINRNSLMMPKNLAIGDAVTIVPDIQDMGERDEVIAGYDVGIVESIYTGRKEQSENSQVTLIFGKIRINYTDLIQIQQQKLVRG